MLKKETIGLLNSAGINFKNIFSICIGKSFLQQKRFIDYLGNYSYWDTDVKKGTLKLDDRLFDVEYIGTTNKSDNFWYSSELEKIIPNKYVKLMKKARNTMKSLHIEQLSDEKIVLDNEINGYNLSMIYIAFAAENVTYFCGSGSTSVYMFVKDLPEKIFKKMNSVEFVNAIMEISSTFNVNHKLMVKALLYENEIECIENKNDILAVFNENSIITINFNDNEFIKNISGNLSL